MKKVIAAVVLAVFTALPAFADVTVALDGIAVSGITAEYDWSLNRVVLSNGEESVVVIINYPYLISGDKMIRLDAPPVIEDSGVMISAYTAARIKEELPERPQAGTPETITIKADAAPEKTDVTAGGTTAEVKEGYPTETPVPLKRAYKAKYKARVKKAYPAVATEPVIPEAAAPVTEDKGKKPLRRRLVVIDPGHGGKDSGALGHHGLKEKDVVLAVALDVKKDMSNYPADVLITRDTDDFITLKGRTVFANARKADIFVSIHCNSSPDSQVCGTRTYIYNRVASSKEAAEAARYENGGDGSFEFLMNDLRKSAYEYLSIELAGDIQHDMSDELKFKWMATERAPFYVLANTDMPAVLVETAFISNSREEEEMKTQNFREKIADGIAKGIEDYFAKIQ
jgi:N-acetylmuramoyl-L-alanine amidase